MRFLFSLSVALFLSLLSGFLQVRGYIIRTRFLNTPAYQNVADWGKDYHLSAETMADFWIGMDFSTWCATAFFFLLPLLAVLPYGSSLHRECKSGYLNLITPQISQKRYFAAKFLASFRPAAQWSFFLWLSTWFLSPVRCRCVYRPY